MGKLERIYACCSIPTYIHSITVIATPEREFGLGSGIISIYINKENPKKKLLSWSEYEICASSNQASCILCGQKESI